MLDIDQLLDDVANAEGLTDFGDPSFRHGLERLAEAVAEEADLNDLGTAAFPTIVAGYLRNRLRVLDWVARHPEVTAVPVEAPVIVAGLPRTGTTALSHFLAGDPANRSLLHWEAADSIPPPTAAAYATDPRFEAARATPPAMSMLNPDFMAIHYDPPEAPVECVVILAQAFASLIYSPMFFVPSYDRWLIDAADLRPSYEYHRTVLQVLQSAYPGRWQLKSPHHGMAVETVRSTYPDARLVWTHRDPVEIVGSVCSLARSLSSSFTGVDHTKLIAEHWLEVIGSLCDRLVAHRAAHGDDGWCDLPYRAIVADPLGAVRDLYERFDLPFTTEVEAGIRDHVAEEPQHKYGKHTYSLDDFGLSAGQIRDRFTEYIERYGDLL